MPFVDDTGVHDDPTRGPVAAAFAALTDQIERLIAVNILWSVQLAPGFAALAFPWLPLAVRMALLAYSVLALAPASGMLFAVAMAAHHREPVNVDLVAGATRRLAIPALRGLGPLYGALGVLLWAVAALEAAGLAGVQVTTSWLLLVGLVTAMFWGPALADDPGRGPLALLRTAAGLVWRAPVRTLALAAVTLAVAALGVLSVGGFFLVVPVVVALLQTGLYRTATTTSEEAVSGHR